MTDKLTEAGLAYLRNIDTRPGPNAGGAIDKRLPPYEAPTPSSADVIEGMREALGGLVALFALPNEDSVEHFERVAALFRKETGYLRPGKDCRLHEREITVNDAIARSMLAKQIFNGVRIYMNGTKLLSENARHVTEAAGQVRP